MEDRELRDRLRIADYLSERDRQDDGHASGNGPYPMRGSMTSEEYIIKLMQTIESLHSTVQGFCEDIAMLRKQKAEDDLERKRLMKLLEAKDEDIRKMADKMTDLLGKVDVLTKALEDKTHQLTNRNRGQFGTKTNRTSAKKNLKGRDDDHEDFSASSDTKTGQETAALSDSAEQDGTVESKPLNSPKSDIESPMTARSSIWLTSPTSGQSSSTGPRSLPTRMPPK